MDDWENYLKLLAGLIAVVDPVGAIPVFVSLTENRSDKERRHSAWIGALAAAVVMLIALVSGEAVLRFFGIGIPAFRVAGGILILSMGLSMLQASHDRSRQTPEEQAESADKDSIAVVPLAIPLLSGPGAISTIIVYANLAPGISHLLMVAGVILAVSILVLLALLMAHRIASALSRTSINIVSRVMGLIIASIAVEFIAHGLLELFPALGKA
jgi:multiple antibiotic resistance protein